METEASLLALAKSIYYVCIRICMYVGRKRLFLFFSFFFIFAKIYLFFSHKMCNCMTVVIIYDELCS